MQEAVADLFAMHWPYKQPAAGRGLLDVITHTDGREAFEIFIPGGGYKNHPAFDPGMYERANVMIEAEAAGRRQALAYYAHSLDAQVIETYGQVRVTHEGSGKPLPGTYVKVYQRTAGGRVRFYKDGYTDLRGRFDYASLSTDDLDAVERFALLVLHEDHGAVIREAAPPKR